MNFVYQVSTHRSWQWCSNIMEPTYFHSQMWYCRSQSSYTQLSKKEQYLEHCVWDFKDRCFLAIQLTGHVVSFHKLSVLLMYYFYNSELQLSSFTNLAMSHSCLGKRSKVLTSYLLNNIKRCHVIYIVIRHYKKKRYMKEKVRRRIRVYLPQVIILVSIIFN